MYKNLVLMIGGILITFTLNSCKFLGLIDDNSTKNTPPIITSPNETNEPDVTGNTSTDSTDKERGEESPPPLNEEHSDKPPLRIYKGG